MMKWECVMIIDHGIMRNRERLYRLKVPQGWIVRYIDYTGRKGPVRHATVYIPGNEEWDIRSKPLELKEIIRRKSPDYKELTYRYQLPEGWLVMDCFYPAGNEQSHISLTYIPDLEHQWTEQTEETPLSIAENHPLFPYREEIQRRSTANSLSIRGCRDSGPVLVAGLVREINEMKTKAGYLMATVKLEDLAGFVDVLFYPTDYKNYHGLIHGQEPIVIKGHVEKTTNGSIVSAFEVKPLQEKTEPGDNNENKEPESWSF